MHRPPDVCVSAKEFCLNQRAAGSPVLPPALQRWALEQLPQACSEAEFTQVAGDASHRRYFRLHCGDTCYIVVDAPPETEKNDAFVAVQRALEAASVRVPGILAVDLENGYMLLEDLGGDLLLTALELATVDGWYDRALALAQRLGRVSTLAGSVPAYDKALLGEELGRFPHWFVEQLLGLRLTAEEQVLLADLNSVLIANALAQPRVLVHRDFHSRNLMLIGAELAVIDFQDAVYGPLTYDPVSLLKDCYVRWPRARVEGWVAAYWQRLVAAGQLPEVDEATFLRWFDLMGLQRHLKVLGVFARLYLRDGKPDYLKDLPRVCAYVEEVLALYRGQCSVIESLAAWWHTRLAPVIAEQSWAGAP